VVCPESYTVTLTSSNISIPKQKSTVMAIDLLPLDGSRLMNWQISGTNGGNPLAVIDNYSGVITPLNDGILTIVGKSQIEKCALGTLSGTVFLNISSQVAPNSLYITGADISTNWGKSYLVATVSPANAPGNVIWSIEPASDLAIINSLTGMLKSTALGNGNVTVKATSLANGVFQTKIIEISGQTVIDCFTINAYNKIVQCGRTMDHITISGFSVGSKITLLAQYYDFTYNPSVNTILGIPADLMNYKLQSVSGLPLASVDKSSNWQLTLNQHQGVFYIIGTYLNDTTKKVQVEVFLNGSGTIPSCPGSEFVVSTICGQWQSFIFFDIQQILFDSIGGSKELSITSNSAWTVSNSTSWLSILPQSGFGNALATITGSKAINTDLRSTNISFAGTGFMKSLPVSQSGLIPRVSVSTNEIKFDFTAGELLTDVTQN
jgi:hypothetical protein